MFRKVLTASIIGFMLTSTLVATSASAATISNGTPCPKAKTNKTTKVGGFVYKCTKNPIIKNQKTAKLTWVSMDCLNTSAAYVKTNAAYLALAKQMPAILADLDVKIAAEQVRVQEATVKADALDLKIKGLTDKLNQFTAARAAIPTNSTDPAVAAKNRSSIATYTSAIRSLTSAIRSNTAAAAGYRKVGKAIANIETTRAAAVLELSQAKGGVAETLSLRALVCGKGL